MAQQMNVHTLKEIGDKWSEAFVRTYAVEGVLLTPKAVCEMNGENSGVRFFIADYEDDEDAGGPYTLLNVYVGSLEDFGKAEQLMDILEKAISEYNRIMSARTMFADSIAELVDVAP
jgi:hypothetical protein